MLNPKPSEVVAPAGMAGALPSIVDRDFLQSEKHQEQHWRAVRDGAHPHILVFEAALVFKLRNLGVPMFASEVWRDAARQKQLYVQGFSQTMNGPHMDGMAVDIIHGVKGWDIPREAWELIGHVGKELAIQNGLRVTWGGDWRTLWDPAHWEISEWRKHKDRTKWPIINQLPKKLRRTVNSPPPKNLISIFTSS